METQTEQDKEQETNGLFVTDFKILSDNSWLILLGKNKRIELKGGNK